MHDLSVFRTHDPSVRASEDILCLGPCDHFDRRSVTACKYFQFVVHKNKQIYYSQAITTLWVVFELKQHTRKEVKKDL
jgi:hypothetical protein